ncbi:MAG: aminotransferase class V-fold PLP-dependent enzyme [Anaerolineales bacterium]
MKDLFLLDPEIIFLNHGSFGATPRPVWEVYQQWQNRLERQPVKFLGRELIPELARARQVLGEFLNAPADHLVFISNATFGVNLIARSLDLKPGDEILSTNHEYGACENVWDFLHSKTGAILVRQPVPLPLASPEEVAEQIWAGVNPNTRVLFLSHITSPTAVHLPVELLCRKARQAGILTFIDGAHAPGQIPLDLQSLGADFYVGNCHKWMLSPKGAGFLYARPEVQPLIEPLVVSWGWGENASYTTGSRFLDQLEWWGTKDFSASLSVPAAIRFMREHDWPAVQARCHQILEEGIAAIEQLTGLDSVYALHAAPFVQLAAARLPHVHDLTAFQAALYDRYRIEVPCIQWQGLHFIRLSVQAYNRREDINALISALADLLPQFADGLP